LLWQKVIENTSVDTLFDTKFAHLLRDLNEIFGTDIGKPRSILDIQDLSLERVMTELTIQSDFLTSPSIHTVGNTWNLGGFPVVWALLLN
jgi:hypothetical protein